MTAIALVGSVTLLLDERTLDRILLPLVAFAAGSLIGGAFFHMIPGALESGMEPVRAFTWTALGFTTFLVVEQLLHYHHCHLPTSDRRRPLTYLVLLGDGLHNLLGGLAVAGTFVLDVRLGIMAWIAAAAHEVPPLRSHVPPRRAHRLLRLAQRERRLPGPLRRGQLPLYRRLRSGAGGQSTYQRPAERRALPGVHDGPGPAPVAADLERPGVAGANDPVARAGCGQGPCRREEGRGRYGRPPWNARDAWHESPFRVPRLAP